MKINKLGQSYNIVDRFHLQNELGETVRYCRVKFLANGKEQVFKESEVANGECFDKSLLARVKESTHAEPVEEAPAPEQEPEELSEELSVASTEESDAEPPSEATYMATFKDADPIEVVDLKAFVSENDLDMEAVGRLITGEQKTHKGWKVSLNV